MRTAPESSGSAERGRAETLLPRKHGSPCGSRSRAAGPSFHLDPEAPAARAALSRQNAVPPGRYRLTTRHTVSAVPSETSTQKSEPWAGPPPGGDAFTSAHGTTPPAGESPPIPGGKPSWGSGERAHFAEGGRRRPGTYLERGPSAIHLADEKKRKSGVSFFVTSMGKGRLRVLDASGGFLLPVLRVQRAEDHAAHGVVPPEEEPVGTGRADGVPRPGVRAAAVRQGAPPHTEAVLSLVSERRALGGATPCGCQRLEGGTEPRPSH